MKKRITEILIILFVCMIATGRGGIVNEKIRLRAIALPTSCTDGEFIVDAADNNFKQCLSNVFNSVSSISADQHTNELVNLGLSTSASAGALTINLEQIDGSTDPSTGDSAVKIAFRSTTLATPTVSIISYTTATTVVITSGGTLGYASGDDAYVYIFAIYDGTNKEIAVAGALFDETKLHSTTAIGAGSDDGETLYSTNARTGAAIRLIGQGKIDAITTAGTWTAINEGVINQGQQFLIDSLVTAPGADNLRIVSATINATSGTPVVDIEHGDWISSLTDSGLGLVTIEMNSGIFSTAIYTCYCTNADEAGGIEICRYAIIDLDTVQYNTLNLTPAASDTKASILCIGER